MEEHSKKFHWLQNNYHSTKKLGREYFLKEVKKLIKDKVDVDKLEAKQKSRLSDIAKKKKELIDKLGFDKRLRKIIEMIDEFCCFQDFRKKYAQIADRHLDLFTIEFSRRYTVDYKIMRWITPVMARKLLKTGKIDVKKLEEIGKCSFFIFYENDKDELFTGKEALEKERAIFSIEKVGKDEIKGMTANKGKAKGYVRILLSPKEIIKMKQGEILVTTMTSPDFVPALRKAKAIVTDEGGVTSHAAIVSRELNIPCVIATKNATKILKDGDFIEVDADKGIVKRIK